MQHLQGYASMLASILQAAHLQVAYLNLSPHLNGIQQQAYPNSYAASPTQSSSPTPQSQSPQWHPTSPQQNHTSTMTPFRLCSYRILNIRTARHIPNKQNHLQIRKCSKTSSRCSSLGLDLVGPQLRVTRGLSSSSGWALPVLDGSPLCDR